MKALNRMNNQIKKVSLLIISAMLMSTGLFAQKSLKNFVIKDLTASLFSTTEEIITAMKEAKEKKAFYEDEIMLEEWMTDLNYWAKSMDSSAIAKESSPEPEILKEEAEFMEESLEIEDWMLDYHWIENENFDEEELKMEEWMQNPENWNIYACG